MVLFMEKAERSEVSLNLPPELLLLKSDPFLAAGENSSVKRFMWFAQQCPWFAWRSDHAWLQP
jgi:hypothetical protein